MRIVKAIGASVAITVSFFYLGCGSLQVAEASHSNGTSPLTIATKQLPSAITGTPYVAVLDASGGTPGYTWSIAGGQLPSGVSLAPTTGILSGTPRVTGNFSVSLAASDSSSPSEVKSSALTIAVAAPPLNIPVSTLASAAVGAPYSQTLQTSGGTAPYNWSVTSGALPAGLTLASSSGVISGTPTAGGTAKFTATVRDSERPTQSYSTAMAITVAAIPLKITTVAVASATSGTAYSQTLQVSGGTPAYTWSIASGSLPAGLILAPTGTISGTPTTSGGATFTAAVTDHSSPTQTISAPFTITVGSTPLTIATPAPGSATVGAAYSQNLIATGGSAPYSWSITSGSLPSGLSLNPTSGSLSGTPTVSGTSTVVATVRDSGNPSQTNGALIKFVIAPPPLKILSSSLAPASCGKQYSQVLQATGGAPGYKWSISSGKLPPGLNLDQTSGTISGTPTSTGAVAFTAAVNDSSSPALAASEPLAVDVMPSALTIVTSTLPGATSQTGYSQTLQASGGTPAYTWSITSGSLPAGLTLSAAGLLSGTPTASGTSSFTATVTDSGSPAQATSVAMTVATAAPAVSPLTITSSTLASGSNGTAYSQSLQASGGTPAYTWSITSGSLPAGLTLAATTGTISGTPTSSGTTNFTTAVKDNGNPVQIVSATTSITVAATQASGPGTTWFIRADGGTRYDAVQVPAGQCDGQGDAAYPGTGVNQHCAFKTFHYLYDFGNCPGTGGFCSGSYGFWAIAGGDTVVVRSCAAVPGEINPSNPNCRLGWSAPTGTANIWCNSQGNNGCANPTIPAGTSGAHTRILAGCAYDSTPGPCNTGNVTNRANLTQLYGGFGLTWAFNLSATQYVDVEGIELTTHNGVCTYGIGNPYPRACNSNQPLDDYAQDGFLFDNTSSNITLQDVYIHGFNADGLYGPIGGPITMTRVFSGFNAHAGWNFADNSDTPDAPGSSITANYVEMTGNGCSEQYPITNPQFPALGCWDSGTGGFGDAWSGQDTELDSFVCHHCVMYYNTKDAFIGPHTQIANLDIQDSVSIGNMGAQWKWASAPNSTVLFQNNLTITNCTRMTSILPGAYENFNHNTGNPGAYLATYCRGGGAGFAFITRQGSTNHFYGNTVIGASTIIFQENCGYYVPGNIFIQETNCGSVPNTFTGNNFLGYIDPNQGTDPPALFYAETPSIHFTPSSYNNEFGLKSGTGDACGTNNITCVDPLLTNEPAQPWPGSEAGLDAYNPFAPGNSFYPAPNSPLIHAGVPLTGSTTDY